MRGADDDDVAGDDRRGVQSDLAVLGIDRLIVVHLQIDNAAGAKRAMRSPVFASRATI